MNIDKAKKQMEKKRAAYVESCQHLQALVVSFEEKETKKIEKTKASLEKKIERVRAASQKKIDAATAKISAIKDEATGTAIAISIDEERAKLGLTRLHTTENLQKAS